MPPASNLLRFPRPGELVLHILGVETSAMLGKKQVILWKGTTVGMLVKAALGFAQQGQHQIFTTQVDGGEIVNVVLDNSTAPAWVWRQV